MSILIVVIVVTVLALGIPSSTVYARDCNFLINGRPHFYRHGQTFIFPQSRCQVYRCNNGHADIVKQGCDFEGQCRAIGSTFVGRSCTTFQCTMPGRHYLRVSPVRGGCKDYYHLCRRPGETFPYAINGQYYSRCQCYMYGGQTYYKCKG